MGEVRERLRTRKTPKLAIESTFGSLLPYFYFN